MGVSFADFAPTFVWILRNFQKQSDLHVCELGNQFWTVDSLLPLLDSGYTLPLDALRYYGDGWGLTSTKSFFEFFGMKHTSFDLNGGDGALTLDLSLPLNFSTSVVEDVQSLLGHCAVVTNFGVTEHVGQGRRWHSAESVWKAQYHAFRHIHALSRCGSMMVHAVPAVDYWPGHGASKYSLQFFRLLSQWTGYRILGLDLRCPSTPQWDLARTLHEAIRRGNVQDDLAIQRQRSLSRRAARRQRHLSQRDNATDSGFGRDCEKIVHAQLVNDRCGDFLDLATFRTLPGISMV
mmetsp:Transcript_844/g.1917  ORF Transcript_844/g.1917 Transcript_844/m.1917 type:complete len:292 (-) Transcript_844:71-946(-)|eukprot:CAMPEP_0117466688 /NCGR_PEP_ID=MMETSP0784-20121206/5272_1 /TAXON_ID=39447 /ORGANISM="" /LENGTH=291 /DNA_ID=CAMNT_0005260639 /DNA_START=32 /DNA_END=907 /DNA_ORIENTATION=-